MDTKPFRYGAPNLVSLASMTLGLASVALSAAGRLDLAAWLVIYSCFLDKADGVVARALGAGSAFGVQMDSFADFTAFGLAPAALMWSCAPELGLPRWWIAFAAWTFPATAAIRLARFNVSGHEDHEFFQGVPTTFAAGLFAATFLTLSDLGVLRAAGATLPSLMVALAVLMVSPLRVPKLKRRRSRALTWLQLAAVAAALAVALLRVLPEVPLAMGVVYLVGGIFVGARSRGEPPQPGP